MLKQKSKLDTLIENFNEQKELLKKQARGLFLEAAQELFEAYPELESFGWKQYTPYFNDGDACTFSVHYPIINGWDQDYGYFVAEGGHEDESRELTVSEQLVLKKLTKPVEYLIGKLPEEIMQEVFGDHIIVKITRDGVIDTEEYNHD